MNRQQVAVLALGRSLKADAYSFVSPTPATHARYLARSCRASAFPLQEVFGWNRPFEASELDEVRRRLLEDADMLEVTPLGKFRSLVRFSAIGDLLFAHSSYPTCERDSVFFGPDTYRFARAISRLADRYPQIMPGTIVDVGTGSGAGGIFARSLFKNARRVVLSDINPKALEFAQINAVLNDCEADFRQSDILKSVEATPDLVISNPPYLIDATERAYRHGGGDWGCALAERILDEALDRLSGDGHLLLYTGAPIVEGVDKFLEAVRPVLRQRVERFRYEETDPDVFGEELENPPYDQADRIATVVLHVNAADIRR